VIGWLGDRGPSSDFLIATMNFGKPGVFEVLVIVFLGTLNEEFCEFSSTFGGQSQRPFSEFLKLTHVGSSSPIV
jgi:hypothetical protein